ncbi:hypothetical protein IFM46972_01532 [Aspergillus udagawae]|uniref:Uncharacterized protein n=1 Tax=Aspergillus udagawae TaxID=91492 RepID=A0A8H3N5I5_9EURO|nr:hypothetical protein IFM46972_01532 [Aspergillus udagawae]
MPITYSLNAKPHKAPSSLIQRFFQDPKPRIVNAHLLPRLPAIKTAPDDFTENEGERGAESGYK